MAVCTKIIDTHRHLLRWFLLSFLLFALWHGEGFELLLLLRGPRIFGSSLISFALLSPALEAPSRSGPSFLIDAGSLGVGRSLPSDMLVAPALLILSFVTGIIIRDGYEFPVFQQ